MAEINSHILQFTGKAELPEAVDIGHNYRVLTEGSIVSLSEHDNEDGTRNRIYKFRPVKIDVLTPLGEALQLKDARSKSQLFRARLWAIWKEQDVSVPFDEWYHTVMAKFIYWADEIVQVYGERN